MSDDRPTPDYLYNKFSTKKYLTGHASKILRDLTKAARMYNGRLVHIFKPGEGGRCTNCTNAITGEIVMTNCPVCFGTGKAGSWINVGEFWSYVDFGPTYNVTSELGNAENPSGIKDQFIILGAPILQDQYLVITHETRKVYKIYDVEPHIVAMQGTVIAQMAQCSPLAAGSQEYRLITWPDESQTPSEPDIPADQTENLDVGETTP